MSLLNMEDLKERVKNLYNKSKNIDIVASCLNISRESVFQLLTNQYMIFLINANKFIAISDTHFGSPKENLQFIDYVYNYAIKENIHYIVHAGDFIEGKSNYTLATPNVDLQIKNALRQYPKDNSITNYLLFGNHDYNALKYDDCSSLFESELNYRTDIYKIGFSKSYLSWNKNVIISVNHEIKDYNNHLPELATAINLYGHHHKYNLENDDLLLPTLSSDIKCSSMPGFTVLELIDDYIEINNFGFLNNQIFYYVPNKVKIKK